MRVQTFAFRVNADERRLLAGLARRLERSQSDVLRCLIRNAAREVILTGADPTAIQRAEGVRYDRISA